MTNGNGKDHDKPTLNPAAAELEGGPIDPTPAVVHPTEDPCDVPAEDIVPAEASSQIEMPTVDLSSGMPPKRDRPGIIIPGSGTKEFLPGDAFNKKMKVSEQSLADLGVKSEDDLGDDIELERSPLDGACVVVSMKNGIQVCSYCFKPFIYGGSMPEYAPAEIEVASPDNESQGVRCKVHGRCQLRKMQGLPID